MSWETCQICDAPLTGGFCSDQDCPGFNEQGSERTYSAITFSNATILRSRGIVNRCPICDWPIVPKGEKGCWEGNCSYRPKEGTAEWCRIKERKERINGHTKLSDSL